MKYLLSLTLRSLLPLLVIDLASGYIETLGRWIWFITIPVVFYISFQYLDFISRDAKEPSATVKSFNFKFVISAIIAVPTPMAGIFLTAIWIYTKKPWENRK